MSLRIVSPTAPTEARAFAEEAGSSVDQYMGRLVKLVPVEAISAYPLLSPDFS